MNQQIKDLGHMMLGSLIGIASLALVIHLSEPKVKAQEKPVRELRTWQMTELSPYWASAGTRIDVIDTEGVCIYIARWSNGIQLSTVPKTQLPKGTGCQ